MILNSKKIMALSVIIAIFFMVLDRFFKILALNLGETYNLQLIGDYVKFNLAQNQYIAFSLPFTGLILNIVIGVIIIFLLIFLLKLVKKAEYLEASLLTFLLLSAINNYYDRLRYGFVIDYINIKYFTVLNISDIMISLATLLLIISIYKKEHLEGE